MFFIKHPYITQTDKHGNTVQVTDIFSTLDPSSFDIYKNSKYSIQYYIREGDTPESISLKLYKKQSYSWIVMIINGMKNVYNDWPLSSIAFDSYVKTKYGGLSSLFFKLDTINNYDIKKGNIITRTGVNNTKAEVIDWNPSLSKLTIKQLSGSFSTNQNISFEGNSNIIANIGRVNLYEQESLHHFEQNGIYIDPLLGYLQGYINGVSNDVITNYEYEIKLNDKKRLIFLPLPEVALRIEKEYSNLMV